MKGIMAAYWHKDGLEVYRVEDKMPVKYASGSLDTLEPIRDGFGKKILIVSRDLALHVRKKYPPASEEKLFKAVRLELGDLFPISNPAFYCRVFQSFGTYTLVDVWAWESEKYSRLREVFPFNYVVPEDLVFSSKDPEVKVFQNNGMTHMLAHADGKFLAGASYPNAQFNQEDVERFLHSLESFGVEIKKIKIYGEQSLLLKGFPGITRVDSRHYPPCLDGIVGLDLPLFKVKGGNDRLWEKKDLVFRIAVYLILGYCLMLYLTLMNYDRTADEMRRKVAVMDRTAASLDKGQRGEDYSTVSREVNEKFNAAHSPLAVMNMLARKLPEGSSINRMALNENNVDLNISSADPLSTIKALWNAKEVKKVSLKGAIVSAKDGSSKMSNFNVAIELAR